MQALNWKKSNFLAPSAIRGILNEQLSQANLHSMRTMTRLIAPLAPVALIVLSAMLYQASASGRPSDAQAEAAGVKALVTANCRPQNPESRIYDLVGIETRVAGGIIVRHPDQLRTVCAVVNHSLMTVSLHELKTSRTLHDLGKERADNQELLALAASFDMSVEEGTALVRAHGRQILASITVAEERPKSLSARNDTEHAVLLPTTSTPSNSSMSLVPSNSGLKARTGASVGLQLNPSSSFGL